MNNNDYHKDFNDLLKWANNSDKYNKDSLIKESIDYIKNPPDEIILKKNLWIAITGVILVTGSCSMYKIFYDNKIPTNTIQETIPKNDISIKNISNNNIINENNKLNNNIPTINIPHITDNKIIDTIRGDDGNLYIVNNNN